MSVINSRASYSPYDIKVEELDENSSTEVHPRNIKVKLWPHQLTLLHRCKQYENEQLALTEFKSLEETHPNLGQGDYMRTQVGIIGDRVGSGKSFVILALMLNNDITNLGSSIKTFAKNRVVFQYSERATNIRTNLLVVPHNLVSQWETYIKDFSDNIKYLIISKMKHVEDFYINLSSVNEYDIIVVTQSYYVRVANFVNSRSLKMQRIIYDEVDNLNIPHCPLIESNFYWFISASYGNLLYPKGYQRYDYAINKHVWFATGLKNSGFVKELFMDLFNNLSREFTKILLLKNQDEYVKSSISIPEVVSQFVKCKSPLSIDILNGFVDREIIHLLNAGDIASALQRISPSRKGTEENIISLQIEKLAKEIYNCDLRLETTYRYDYDLEEQRQTEITRLQNKKNSIQAKIDGIRERIKQADTCCICFDNFVKKSVPPCCSQSYCFVCINIWLSKHQTCPTCKQKLSIKDLFIIDDSIGEEDSPEEQVNPDELNANFDKIQNLEIIFKQKASNGKILVYSSYDMSFNHITEVLEKLNIRYAYLKGNENQIKKTIERYKEEDLNVLLVNGRNYGSGLNLENTSDIIMFHKVDSEVEKQIIGRGQRFGRVNALNVWYLLHENEMK